METMNIPPKGKSTGRKPIYNLQNIEAGGAAEYTSPGIRQAVTQYAKRTGKKFTCRKRGNKITVYRTE